MNGVIENNKRGVGVGWVRYSSWSDRISGIGEGGSMEECKIKEFSYRKSNKANISVLAPSFLL